MSDVTPIGGHLISPFSTPVAYENPEYSGFIGFVRNSIHEPVGKEATILYKNSKGEWKAVKSKVRTRFGNISWRGPKKKEDKEYPRWVISYHGPQTRSLPTAAFTYGSDSKHREIYMGGGLIGVAPGPVLGACIQIIKKVKYLLVVCLVGGSERVIRRKLEAPVFAKSGPPVEALAKFANGEKDKKGWKDVGTLSIGGGYLPPETPWFFNESGTQAQCMRRKDKVAVIDGEETTEKAADRFRLTVEGLNVEPLGNKPAIASYGGWTPAGIENGGFVLVPDPYGVAHIWRGAYVSAGAWSAGEQVVAVDYDEDKEVLARVRVSTGWYGVRFYMEGCDTEFRIGALAPNDMDIPPNWVRPTGARWYNPWLMGYRWNGKALHEVQINILYPKLPSPMLDSATMAETPLDGTTLIVGPDNKEDGIPLEYVKRLSDDDQLTGREGAGAVYTPFSASMQATGRPQDPLRLGRVEYAESFVHHLDLRDRDGVCLMTRSESKDDYNISPIPAIQTDLSTEELRLGDTEEPKFLLPKGPGKQSTFTEGGELFNPAIDVVDPSTLEAQFRQVVGDPEHGVVGWPRTGKTQWFATTWSGSRPKHDDATAQRLLPLWFVPSRQQHWREGWYGVNTLYHDKHYKNYPHYGACGAHYIVSGVSQGSAFGEMEGGDVLSSNIPNISALLKGKLFYPFSEL